MDRREFLLRSSALTALGAFGLPAIGDDTKGEAKPPFRISLAQWSLHKTFFGKKADAADFPKIAKKDYGIEAVEYVNQFYKDKKGKAEYFTTLRKSCDDLGVTSVLIMCDGEGALGDADPKKRTKAVENHYAWVEAAKTLGCHSIRVNAQSSGTPDEQTERAADGLRALTEWAAKLQIHVIVENHGGLSSNGAWLAGVMKKVNLPGCGTLPDFGNFNLGNGKEYDRYLGVTELMPFAKAYPRRPTTSTTRATRPTPTITA